jgi:hypothetical protein
MCTGDLARTFRFAACACDTFWASGELVTDGLTSTGAGQANTESASIGANGRVLTNSSTSVGGSVWAGGVAPQGGSAVSLLGQGSINREVHAGGDLEIGQMGFSVEGAVFVNGNIDVQDDDAGSNNFVVGGAVHVPEGGVVSPAVMPEGGVVRETITVDPPCDCSNPIPVGSIVSSFAPDANNDNAHANLTTTVLDWPPQPVELTCGRYYVDGITGGAVEIDVRGRVGLFVDGDVSVDTLTLTLATADAELDLFVAGAVKVITGSNIGDLRAPASRVRLYVGGSIVDFGSTTTMSANVYAVNATVDESSDFTMFGALFANVITLSGRFQLHYDTSVLGVPGCAPDGGSCTTCNDCSGATPACVGGTCVRCTRNAECCAPLVCNAGLCVQPTQ